MNQAKVRKYGNYPKQEKKKKETKGIVGILVDPVLPHTHLSFSYVQLSVRSAEIRNNTKRVTNRKDK